MKDETIDQKATFGTGCFWCSEAGFCQLPGVVSAIPGYMGGHAGEPAYEDVCSGKTGHAEVVQVTYNPKVLAYQTLLDFFFKIHDPTQLNRQGGDVGTQYRSVIFYHTPEQKALAQKAIADQEAQWDRPVVTLLEKAGRFYPAENCHVRYYERNKTGNSYCQLVIKPKLSKLGLDH